MNDLARRDFLRGAAGGLAGLALVPELDRLFPVLPPGAPLRTALVGCGKRGKEILAELAKIDGVELAAICDRDPGKLKSGGRRAKEAARYASVEELLAGESELQAVLVATSTDQHRPVAEAALAAGKHVWCEAPLANTIEDARALAAAGAAAAAAGRVFAAGFTARTNPVYGRARSVYKAGGVRSLVAARGAWFHKESWRAVAPTDERQRLLDWRVDPARCAGLPGECASHAIDALLWFTKETPTRVAGHGAILLHDDGREVADTVWLDLALAKGRRMSFEGSIANSFEGDNLVLRGTHGTIKLAQTHAWLFKEADAVTMGWEVYAHRQPFHRDEGIVLLANATQLADQGKLEEGAGLPNPPLYYSLHDFAAAVLEGTAPACGAAEALPPTVLGILADQAVRRGEELAVEPALLGLEG
ncbi:MAG: gfo/Idh/MocA family oxidoreductase [Planctomycetota bacterium]|nr:MAG: gfo/Idh/MocA family oxidoreductase [Planctomycetota bacterium]